MKKITDIDKNFKNKSILRDDMKLYNVRSEPFDLYGFYKPYVEKDFRRMPENIVASVSERIEFLSRQTSGGRVRFRTDSKYVALKVVLPEVWSMPRTPLTGSIGCDLYVGDDYYGTFVPECSDDDRGYESILEFHDEQMRDITINFPLYNRVDDLFVGISENAKLEHGREYKHKLPVVFYGSSITQGGCASRPGCMYPAILSRKFDFDYINLGFSGSARAEDAMADYIASLDMSLFIYDYDHNSPSVEHFRKTHYPMYKKIRDAHPDMPVVMLSRPNRCGSEEEINERINVILETLVKAKQEGDNNLYFINGQDILNRYNKDIFTVDNCHPTDFGFYCIADAISDVIGRFFE